MKIQILTLATAIALLAGCTSARKRMGYAKAVTFNQLPPAAQTTVRNEIGNQPIARITEDNNYGQQTFRVEVEQPGLNGALWVASDGSIIKESRRLVSHRAAVNEAAGAQAPKSDSMKSDSNKPEPKSDSNNY
jgi:hypothetical protein